MHGRILKGPKQWANVEPVWSALLGPAGPRSFEHRLEWVRAFAEEWQKDDARWFLATDDDGPVAAMPYKLQVRRVGSLRVRVLLNEWGADLLVAPRVRRPEDVRRALLDASAAAGEPIDVLSLNRLHSGSGVLWLATAAPSGLRSEPRHGGHSVIDTQVTGDEWFAAAGKNLRASVRKARNRFERAGKMTITVAESRDEIAAGFEEFVAIEATGWKRDQGAFVNRAHDRELMKGFLLNMGGTGDGFVRTLRLDGRPAAAQLGCVTAGVVALHKIAYDDGLADLSPSNILMADLVRCCCDDPAIDRIDMITNQPWHARWHAKLLPTYQARDVNLRRPGGLATRGATVLEHVGVRLPKP